MQEEIARSNRLVPYNATFGQVFEDVYTPFEDTELRLAPSANPSPDPNAKMCFKESDVYDKCPQLIPKPAPKIEEGTTVCTTYKTGGGDGYTQQFGDVPFFGGFSPHVPSSSLEPMHFGVPPTDSALQTAKAGDLNIKNGNLKLWIAAAAGMSIASVKYKNADVIAKKPGFAFVTAAFDVPKGTGDIINRVDEAGLLPNGGTASKIVRRMATPNAAYTKVQPAYAVAPGIAIQGKMVPHTSTLSPYMISKRVTISQNNVVRYVAGVTAPAPFTSARFAIPRMTLLPKFNAVYALDASKRVWIKAPRSMTSFSTKKYSAVAITDGKVAVGFRVVDAPRPTSFGSTFGHSTTYNVVVGGAGTPVAILQTLGTRGGNKGRVLAPAGTYSVTTDVLFGAFDAVRGSLGKAAIGKAACPVVSSNIAIVPGKVVAATKDNAQITYGFAGQQKKLTYVKKNHGFKARDAVNVHVLAATGKVVNVTRRFGAPTEKAPAVIDTTEAVVIKTVPHAGPGTTTVRGTVKKRVTNGYEITYTFNKKPKKATFITNKVVDVGSVAILTINKNNGKIIKIQVTLAKSKPAPKPAPKPADDKKDCTVKKTKECKDCGLYSKANRCKGCVVCKGDKPAPKPAPKPGAKPAPKPGAKPAPKPGAKPKPAPKPASKPASKPGAKPSPKPASVSPKSTPSVQPCPFSFQTRNSKGQCVGCPTDKPHWDGKACIKCPADKPNWDGKKCYMPPFALLPSTNVPDGGSCRGGNQCKSGFCSSGNKCYTPKNLPDGAYCTGGNQCASGKCGSNRKCYGGQGSTNLTDGQSCSGGNQCKSGYCGSDKKCYTPRNLSDGSYCTGGNQCASGKCGSNRKCYGSAPANSEVNKPNGTYCTGGNQCASGRCSAENRCY